MKATQLLERARHFVEVDLWSANLEGAGRGRVLLYRLGRAVAATVKGFFDRELTVRAASLTYYTVLSIVPFLAFAFSLLKGFGVTHTLVEESLRPYLTQTFAGNDSLLQAIGQVLSFVERTSVSGLSIVGVIFLGYTSVTMLSSIETAFNSIWEARSARRPLRKVTDYTTMMIIGPLLILAALALGTAAQNSSVVEYLRRSSVLGGLVNLVFRLASLSLASVAFVALYLILPNVRTRFGSALVGGVVAGLLWQGALFLQVKFQVGVAKYNALYAGFAALPIFLVWLYLSWIIVLVGAELAASSQYELRYKHRRKARDVDQELRERVAVAAAAVVGRRFVEGRPPVTSLELAAALELPPPTVEAVLDALVRASLLVRVDGAEPAYDPARDLDAVHLAELEGAVRVEPGAEALKRDFERAVGEALAALLRARRAEGATALGAMTLRQLAAQSPIVRPDSPPSSAPAPGGAAAGVHA